MGYPPSKPAAPSTHTITTGGTAVTVFPAGSIANGADIINPASATEILYIDFVTNAVAGSATSIPIAVGATYRLPWPITSELTAVSATTGHAFVAVRY